MDHASTAVAGTRAGAAPRSASALADAYDTATGNTHRDDPVLAGTGGPAGNARLTAWTGLLLLPLIAAELLTLLGVRQLISWHIAIGIALIPVAFVKTAATSWRVVRYYARNAPYTQAGPPPLLLRVLGPLVVAGTFAVLGTGVTLIALGQQASQQTLFTLLSHPVSYVTLHQVAFIAWAVFTGTHILGRLVPAVHIASGRTERTAVHGRTGRATVIVLALGAAGLAAVLVVNASSSWTHGFAHERGNHAIPPNAR